MRCGACAAQHQKLHPQMQLLEQAPLGIEAEHWHFNAMLCHGSYMLFRTHLRPMSACLRQAAVRCGAVGKIKKEENEKKFHAGLPARADGLSSLQRSTAEGNGVWKCGQLCWEGRCSRN